MPRQTYYYQGNRNTLPGDQVAQIAYQAGFRGEDLVTAVAIAHRESGWAPNIHGTEVDPSKVSGDRGLWQINSSNDAGLKAAGIINQPTDLFNPVINARAAYYLYSHEGNDFAPAWSVGSGGWDGVSSPIPSQDRMNTARQAVTTAGGKGLFGIDWKDFGGNILTGVLTGGVSLLPGIPDFPNPLNVINGINDAVVSIVKALLDPSTWIRLVQILGGGIVFLIGLYVLVGDTAPVQQLTSAAKVAAMA